MEIEILDCAHCYPERRANKMGCDCYRIGGPFIAEDPDCPIHGHEAQRRERIEQEARNRVEDRLSELEHRVAMIDINLSDPSVQKRLAPRVPDVDALAQFIREVDGSHKLGAAALAEKIVGWIGEMKHHAGY